MFFDDTVAGGHPANGQWEVSSIGVHSKRGIDKAQHSVNSSTPSVSHNLQRQRNDVFAAYQNNEASLPQNEQNRKLEVYLLQDEGRTRALGIHDFWKRTVTAGVDAALQNTVSNSRQAPPLRDNLTA
jgi:hypothetical protein